MRWPPEILVASSPDIIPAGDMSRSGNAAFQPQKFTSYERDYNGTDEAMFRRYNRWHARFDQPDPYDGSYDLADPQSFNRYAYVQGDPVNFVDPMGLINIPFIPIPYPPNLIPGVGFWSNVYVSSPILGGGGGGGACTSQNSAWMTAAGAARRILGHVR